MINIIEYEEKYSCDVIGALVELQAHEYSLSDTRKAPSINLMQEYLLELISNVQTQNGKIFICIKDNKFVGFISYYIEKNDIIFEKEDSNIYALVSDICVLKKFQNQGIARNLINAVVDSLKIDKFIGRLRINTLANNLNAIKAYNKYGFKPYEITYERKI